MKNGLMTLAFSCGLALLPVAALAQPQQPQPTNAPAEKLDPKQQIDRMSYAIGMDIGRNLQRGGVELDIDRMAAAMKDAQAGKPSALTDQQIRDAITMYRDQARLKHEEQMKKAAEKNHAEGDAFLAANKGKPGIVTKQVTLPDGKNVEFQYRVITNGTGALPKTNDTVTINFRGTLINGKEFDASAKRGQPAKFPLNHGLPGWTEALSMMPVGSKWEVFLPPALAYGDRGNGPVVEPGSTVIYELELLNAETPAPQPPPQPLTSDIIKVPSAEELKKGAKIEVIKAEDLEKMTNSASQKK